MKKLYLFLPLLLLPNFISCNNTTKINTLFGINNINNRKVKEISLNELKTLKDDESSFILIQTTTSCHCSTEFIENIVNKYIKETGLLIYSIDYNQIKELETEFYIREDSPTFHVVINGKNNNKYEKVYSSSTLEFFTNYDTFKNEMDKTFASPSLFYVDEDELDDLYNKNNKFVVYFAKSDCYECKILTNTLFYEYGATHLNMKPIYVLDYKGYSEEEFDKSRIKYGLNETSDPTWGYKTGALPTLYTINPTSDHDKIKSIDQGFTFGNDILDNNYKVKYSYYTEDRIKNIRYTDKLTSQIDKQYKESEVIKDSSRDVYYLNKEMNLKIYKDIFLDYMNYIDTFLS